MTTSTTESSEVERARAKRADAERLYREAYEAGEAEENAITAAVARNDRKGWRAAREDRAWGEAREAVLLGDLQARQQELDAAIASEKDKERRAKHAADVDRARESAEDDVKHRQRDDIEYLREVITSTRTTSVDQIAQYARHADSSVEVSDRTVADVLGLSHDGDDSDHVPSAAEYRAIGVAISRARNIAEQAAARAARMPRWT
jgi:hypothetical protein